MVGFRRGSHIYIFMETLKKLKRSVNKIKNKKCFKLFYIIDSSDIKSNIPSKFQKTFEEIVALVLSLSERISDSTIDLQTLELMDGKEDMLCDLIEILNPGHVAELKECLKKLIGCLQLFNDSRSDIGNFLKCCQYLPSGIGKILM